MVNSECRSDALSCPEQLSLCCYVIHQMYIKVKVQACKLKGYQVLYFYIFISVFAVNKNDGHLLRV